MLREIRYRIQLQGDVMNVRVARSALVALVFAFSSACSGDDDDDDKQPYDAGPRLMDAGTRDASIEPPNPTEDDDAGVTCSYKISALALGPLLSMSFSEYCADRYCPSALAGFEETLLCVEPEDGGALSYSDYPDAGVGRAWVRGKGCARVRFRILGEMPYRQFDFDPATGELIAIEEIYDIDTQVRGTSCKALGIAVGSPLEECGRELIAICEER
jgi:hypothetical protein